MRDLPERYGPRTTCYNLFVRWRKAGVWGRMMEIITTPQNGLQHVGSRSPTGRDSEFIGSVVPEAGHDQNPCGRRWARPPALTMPDRRAKTYFSARLYRERNLIERFFSNPKDFRRVY